MFQQIRNLIDRRKRKNSEDKPLHLTSYYYLVEILGFVMPIAIAISAIFFPEYFRWFTDYPVSILINALLIYGLCDIVFLLGHEITGKNIFFTFNRYLYVCLYIFVIIITGGVNSSFIFIIIFPLIVSVVYLDKNTTRNIGIFLTVLYSLIIFVQPSGGINEIIVAKHVIQIVLVSIVSWLMYRIVVETLSQKYEKDDTARRLTELIHIDNVKNDFLSLAQHRLRTPLSGVRWALETLMEDQSISASAKPIISESLERVKDSISIVNDMLKTAENNAGTSVSLSIDKIDLSTLLHDIIRESAFVASKNSTSFYLDIVPGIMIEADKKKIYSAFGNIIDNAFRYTKKGSVSVSLKKDGGEAICTVTDNGIGIDSGDLPYIFDRLHRGKNAMTMEPDESGIGLYVSKKIIEMHRGRIGVESKLNKGTTITVTLPISE